MEEAQKEISDLANTKIENRREELKQAGYTDDAIEEKLKNEKESIEKEAEAEYIEANPDYADAKAEELERFGNKEGKGIKEQYNDAMKDAEKEFLSDADNKEPKLKSKNPTEKEIEEYQKAHKEWEAKKQEFLEQKEEEYKKEHPEYAYYKQQTGRVDYSKLLSEFNKLK